MNSLRPPSKRRGTTGFDQHEIRDPERKRAGYRAPGCNVGPSRNRGHAHRLARSGGGGDRDFGCGLDWYRSSGLPAPRKPCRRATLEARNRAQAASDALELSVESEVEIRLIGGPGSRPRQMALRVAKQYGASMPPVAPDVEPGEISVCAEVEGTFRVEPKARSGPAPEPQSYLLPEAGQRRRVRV